ncbi:unnamed protein product (macronuclear) [Paramecium tetraurelia]|uniref:Transmembrane protein n=1 Tax=Paramecium tetraurelia TaxID=5888 RepID=A0C1U9_PARTE|nr:uncharacterized protein GSPATT00034243001 [Paramecium tetraurelia]CAK64766.1 unnamed protein product [Paramecium tetraurelia]|eukprot:XP_001432163.1 hypothetical protein (macronuclear) [Paramecium tetraurelia strain d4-2]
MDTLTVLTILNIYPYNIFSSILDICLIQSDFFIPLQVHYLKFVKLQNLFKIYFLTQPLNKIEFMKIRRMLDLQTLCNLMQNQNLSTQIIIIIFKSILLIRVTKDFSRAIQIVTHAIYVYILSLNALLMRITQGMLLDILAACLAQQQYMEFILSYFIADKQQHCLTCAFQINANLSPVSLKSSGQLTLQTYLFTIYLHCRISQNDQNLL